MAVTIDPRPTVFGDRFVVTGSYEAGDTSIDLSAFFSSIDTFSISPESVVEQGFTQDDGTGTGTLNLLDVATVSGTTITVYPAQKELDADGGGPGPATAGSTVAGTFFAIGRRA
jgi:hypothetical protein